LEDYAFFGQVYRWPPSEIDNLGWNTRKTLKQAYLDSLQNK